MINDAGFIKPSAVVDVEIASGSRPKNPANKLSMNLLGIFRITDMVYNCGKGEWIKCVSNLKEKIEVSKYELETKEVLAVYVKDIHNLSFEYNDLAELKNTYKTEWDSFKGQKDKIEEFSKRNLSGLTKIIHAPIIKNFWHFEWHFKRQNNEPFPGSGEKAKTLFIRKLEILIVEKFRVYNNSLEYGKLNFRQYLSLPCFLIKIFKKIGFIKDKS